MPRAVSVSTLRRTVGQRCRVPQSKAPSAKFHFQGIVGLRMRDRSARLSPVHKMTGLIGGRFFWGVACPSRRVQNCYERIFEYPTLP
jgi:hypothetical protein